MDNGGGMEGKGMQMMVNTNAFGEEGMQISVGEQWQEWNQHVEMAALKAAPQQLQQQCHQQVSTTQKPGHPHLLAKTEPVMEPVKYL